MWSFLLREPFALEKKLEPTREISTKEAIFWKCRGAFSAAHGLGHPEVGLQVWQTLFPEIKLEIYTYLNTFSPFHVISLRVAHFCCWRRALSELPLDQTGGTFSACWTATETRHFTKITHKQVFLHWNQTSLSSRIYHWNTAASHLPLPFLQLLFFNITFTYSKSWCLGRHAQVLHQRTQHKDLNRTGCCVGHNLD